MNLNYDQTINHILYFLGSIDGVDSNAPVSWLRYSANQTVSGSIIVNGSLTVGQLQQDSWLINAIDMSVLLNHSVRIDRPNNFTLIYFGNVIMRIYILDPHLKTI